MILKKETEDVIENFIAKQLGEKNISPDMVAAIAELIRAFEHH